MLGKERKVFKSSSTQRVRTIVFAVVLALGLKLSAAPNLLLPSLFSPRSFSHQPTWTKNTAYFIANRGQFSQPVEFAVQDQKRIIFFTPKEVVFFFPGENPPWVVKTKFIDSQETDPPEAEGNPEGFFSYFRGEKKEWKTAVPAFKQIRYSELWPGIDLVYSTSDKGLKSEFIVGPGACPSQIRLAIEGATGAVVDPAGRLVISTPDNTIIDETPWAYQMIEGKRVEIKVSYQLETHSVGQGEDDMKPVCYSFSLGSYDPTRELVIDPILMGAGSYVGGPSFDYAYGIALDRVGQIYLTGYTYSASNFPLMSGPQLSFGGGDVDAYIAKLDPSSARLVYCGYLGGDDRDFAYDVAVDEAGNAYVVGYTASRETSFPVVRGPGLTARGRYDAFIAKINPAGTKLEYCGFLGGSEDDYGRGVAVDDEGRAYITGSTLSGSDTFPVQVGPVLTPSGNSDAFVARISPSGERLEYCGFLGGPEEDYAYGIAIDAEGCAYIAGSTRSGETFFPVLSGPDLSFNGSVDAFVAKVAASGENLIYSGYIGGTGEDVATAISVDDSGCAYLTGFTASDENSFPLGSGPDSIYNGGFYDAFAAKVSSDGTSLVYSGYIGGDGYDVGTGIAVDIWGCAYIVGYTSSRPDSFPDQEGPDLTFHGSFDAFLAKVKDNGQNLIFCGYFGGSGGDFGEDVAIERTGSGAIYIAGSTYSTDLSFSTPLLPTLSFQGKRDSFVVRYAETSITLVSPRGGETWYSGFKKNILWRSVGKVGPVRIEFSSDRGETWEVIADETENDGLFIWVVPDISSTTCFIRVSEADDGVPSDTNASSFFIVNTPVIVVTSPNGGEEWPVGSTQEITWVTGSAPVGEVRIEYTADGGLNWIEIVGRTENNGVYPWLIPDTPSTECLVRISEADDGDPVDRSDSFFSIVASNSDSLSSNRAKKQGEGLRPARKEETKKPGKKNSVGGDSI